MTFENKKHRKIKTNYFQIGMIFSVTAILSFFILNQNQSFADTVLFSDDFSSYATQTQADGNWTSSDVAKVRVNISADLLDFNLSNNLSGDSDAISFDLNSVSVIPQAEWSLRYKTNFTSITDIGEVLIGISSKDSSTNFGSDSTQDALLMQFLSDTTNSLALVYHNGAGRIIVGTIPFDYTTNTNYYIELKRTGSLTAQLSIFSDPNFSVLLNTTSGAIGSGIDNLRYIKIGNVDNSVNSGNHVGTIDDVQFLIPDVIPTCNGLTATITGNSSNNVIVGTAGNDVIAGLGGNDLISGMEGNDTICGGDGEDMIFGNEGNDFVDGEAGKDLLSGNSGIDELRGSAGDDRLIGGSENDTLKGNAGSDMLVGEAGEDSLNGGNDFDICDGGSETNSIAECEL
jgi:Ca2+-binding RTX toxin-like protein